jgi:peroxiredoxin
MNQSRVGTLLRWLTAGCLALAAPAWGQTERAVSKSAVGEKIGPILLESAAGTRERLQDLGGKRATVVVFLSFECPICTGYLGTLADLARSYSERGVLVLGVCAGEDESCASIVRRREECKLPFAIFRDDHYAAADALQAQITPEAFLLDEHSVLRYRGRIDDGYTGRLQKRQHVSSHNLRQALDEVLAGKPVTVAVTTPVGCPIARTSKPASASGPVTYYRDVLPVLQTHCQGCHRPGEVGPFSLMTYRQAVNWAADIKEFTQNRKMPPWKPVAGLPFEDERKLSDRDIATLAAWVEGGTPEGDGRQAPPPRHFSDGWQLGPPDLVLQVDQPFQLAADGRDLFRCFVLPTGLTEDKYVTAVEIRPGNRRVVHHALVFVDTSGAARKLDSRGTQHTPVSADADGGPGYSMAMGVGFRPTGGLGGWAPGNLAHRLPEGTGYLLPRGADVVIQVHYHRDGRLEQDNTKIGLQFARRPVGKQFRSLVIAGGSGRSPFFVIPPGATHFPVQGSLWVDEDCEIHTVTPHMHLLGREIRITMTPPEGSAQTLVAIRDWDYNWQEAYRFKRPVNVKAGTRFDIEAFYDNSNENPNNPNHPARLVFFGEQTTNEMCYGFMGATSDRAGRIKQHRAAASGPPSGLGTILDLVRRSLQSSEK